MDSEATDDNDDELYSELARLGDDEIRERIGQRERGLTALELRFLGGDKTALPIIGSELLDIAWMWSELRDRCEDRGETHAAADAASEAYAVVKRALPKLVDDDRDDAIELWLFLANEIAVYHFDRDPRAASANLLWTEAIALREANPHLSPTQYEARLYSNRGGWLIETGALPAARASLDRAISIYAELDENPQIQREFARAWRKRAEASETDEERDHAYAVTLAMYELDADHLETLHFIAGAHHDRALAARRRGAYDDAIEHHHRALRAFERVLSRDPSDANQATRAAYRGWLALSLGDARRWQAALDEARPAMFDMQRLLSSMNDSFVSTTLGTLARNVNEWLYDLNPDPSFACVFCLRNRRDVKKLISGPKVYICDSCVGLCLEIIAKDWPIDPVTKQRTGTPKRNAKGSRCNFCGVDERRAFVQGPQHVICDDCVDLCAQIIEDEIAAET